MDLSSLTRSVQEQLAAGAALGDESAQRAAQLLALSLEPALRLVLQEAIGQVATEVSAEIAPGRVELVLDGGQLALRVVPPPAAEPVPPAEPPIEKEEGGSDAPVSRVTFRPPQPLKARLEQAAVSEGLSLNTYLVRALTAHLERPATHSPPIDGAGRTSGWFL